MGKSLQLKPSGKNDRIITGVCRIAPFDLGTTLPYPLQTNVVGPPDGDPSERVRVRVVPTINRLPFKVPPNFRGRAKTVVDGCVLVSRPKSCLSRCVPNDWNATTYKPSSQSAAVRFPMFSCEYGQEMQCEATCVCLGEWNRAVTRDS